MSSETVETSPPCSGEVFGIFDKAFRAFEDSMKVAMKAQEDTVKFWGEAMGKGNPVQVAAADWIPAVQKNTDEYLRLLESSYKRNAEVLKKVMSTNGNGSNGASGEALEKRTRELWEASMEAARSNAEDLVSTNMRVAQSWSEAFKKGNQPKETVGK